MQVGREDLTRRLVDLVLRAFASASLSAGEELSEVDLTRSQLRSLVYLRLGPGHARMTDLAGHLGISLSAATSLADRLVSKGLMERGHESSDRRVVTCRLTRRGQDEVGRFWWLGQRKAEAIAAALSDTELDTVVHAFEVLSAALDRRSAAGPPAVSSGSPMDTSSRLRE